jgi:metal-responsive CopG/Arc/MetJ family transcriptional regulator
MAIVQVVLDKELLQATDKAAKRTKQNRSALVRDALRQHLRSMEIRAKEQREREGYLKHPQTEEEFGPWEVVLAWPEE